MKNQLDRADEDSDQLTFGFTDDERRQLDRDRAYWRKWLETVDQDLIDEPARIRDFYQIELARIEPIGLVYLWPNT